jgi:hypothetical protein
MTATQELVVPRSMPIAFETMPRSPRYQHASRQRPDAGMSEDHRAAVLHEIYQC